MYEVFVECERRAQKKDSEQQYKFMAYIVRLNIFRIIFIFVVLVILKRWASTFFFPLRYMIYFALCSTLFVCSHSGRLGEGGGVIEQNRKEQRIFLFTWCIEALNQSSNQSFLIIYSMYAFFLIRRDYSGIIYGIFLKQYHDIFAFGYLIQRNCNKWSSYLREIRDK